MEMIASTVWHAWFRDTGAPGKITLDQDRPGNQDGFEQIRCPLCEWRPSASSRWLCECVGTPEPPFAACRTAWNTFSTRGRCPRCAHQWRWTSCLRCSGWSLHEDWYEEA